MDTKHRKQVLGGVVFLAGCFLLLSLLRVLVFGHIASLWTTGRVALIIWNVGRLILFAGLAVYFVCAGLRLMNPQLIKPPRFGWGKILIGSWLVFVEVGSLYHLVPEAPIPTLKPSNPTQATSMKATGIVIGMIGVYLIFRGIWTGFTRFKSQPDIDSPQSPA